MYSNITEQALECMQQRLTAPLEKSNGRAVLMFSGGRDSTAVAATFCTAFPDCELHLLMIDNGLLSLLDSTKRQARHLQRLFPKVQMPFEVKRVSEMMRVAGMQHIERDFTETGFKTLLICLGCKAIMNVSAMRYARELGISLVIDGYAERQKEFPEQTDAFMDRIKELFQKADVTYISPLYDVLGEKSTVNQINAELGVMILKQEPICMFADAFSPASNDDIGRYTDMVLERIAEHNATLHC